MQPLWKPRADEEREVPVPIFELDQTSLVPYKRQAIASGIYEIEIEQLLWDNLEELTGDNLFRLARQGTLPAGGKPDLLALDATGRGSE